MANSAQNIKGTTQEFIEILDILDDIVLLKDGSCALIVETAAVNFNLLSKEEQDATIVSFAALLNSLSFPIQIVVRSQKLDLSSYIKNLNEKMGQQQNPLLKNQMEKYIAFVESLMRQNTILDKRFYIIVPFSPLEGGISLASSTLFKKAGVPSQKQIILEKAKHTLYPKRDQILGLLSRIGLKGTVLGKTSLIALFFSIYNQGTEGGRGISQDAKGVFSPALPDLIAPPSAEIDFNFLRIGSTYYRTLFVLDYPRYVSPNWLSPLISFDHTLDISMFVYPIEPGDVLSDLRRKIAEMEATISSQIEEGKEIDPQTKAALDDALSLQEELVKGTERFFQFGFYIAIPAKTPEELETVTKRVLATLSSLLIVAKPATLQMEDGFKTTLPLGIDRLMITRNMDTTSLATTFPFTSSELTSNEGILYGINQPNGSLIVFDRFSLENANSLVLGKSGGGKSFLIKLEALRSLMLGTEIIVIDPESEYQALSEAVGGENISFKSTDQTYINPFDLSLVVEEGENALQQKILSLNTLMKVIMGELTPTEEAILDQALMATYAKLGITQDPKTQQNKPPVMEDLYNSFMTMPDQTAKNLALRLERFVKGSLSGTFSKPSTIDIKNPFTVFSLRDIEEAFRPIAMYIVLDFIWTKVRKDIRRRLLVVDEAWHLMKYKDSANFLVSLAKRARKYALGLTTITQDAEDFLSTEHGKTIVTNSSIQILLKQSPAAMDIIAKTFNLSYGERHLLLGAGIGTGLFFAGLNHVAIQVVAAPHEKELVSSQPKIQPQTQSPTPPPPPTP